MQWRRPLTASEARWAACFAHLVAFARRHGHCQVSLEQSSIPMSWAATAAHRQLCDMCRALMVPDIDSCIMATAWGWWSPVKPEALNSCSFPKPWLFYNASNPCIPVCLL